MIGTLYCPVFMSWRFFDGSYAAGGKFAADVAASLSPSFNVQKASNPLLVFKLLTMVSTAYVAHYSAPAFLNELKDPTKKRFNSIVCWGFGVSFVAMQVAMYMGFMTFGGNSAGFVLNNYANRDMAANVARVAVGLGVLFGYPLIFTALREGSFDLLGANDAQRSKYNVPFTASILAAVTGVALVVKNLGSVVSFSGALTGSALIYITPAVMNLGLQRKDVAASGSPILTRKQKTTKFINYAMLIFGLLCSFVGVGIFTAGL
jgi:amino acid permease